MCDLGMGCKEHFAASVPDPFAQIHLLALIEELGIEAAQFLEQSPSEHDTAAGLPVHFAFGISMPARIDYSTQGAAEASEPVQAESQHPEPAHRRSDHGRRLVPSIQVNHPATEGTALRVLVSE